MELESKTFKKNAYSIYEFAYIFQKGPDTFLVAYENEQLVGYISAYVENSKNNNKKIGYICSLAVDKTFRRKGIGRQLIQQIITIIKKKSDVLELHVRQSNHVAISLYKSMNFNIKSSLEKYYEDDEDAYLMLLQLSG